MQNDKAELELKTPRCTVSGGVGGPSGLYRTRTEWYCMINTQITTNNFGDSFARAAWGQPAAGAEIFKIILPIPKNERNARSRRRKFSKSA